MLYMLRKRNGRAVRFFQIFTFKSCLPPPLPNFKNTLPPPSFKKGSPPDNQTELVTFHLLCPLGHFRLHSGPGKVRGPIADTALRLDWISAYGAKCVARHNSMQH